MFDAPDVAKVLRKKLALNDGRQYGEVKLHLVGAGALWAGMVDLTKEDLKGAERVGFPVVALILLACSGPWPRPCCRWRSVASRCC